MCVDPITIASFAVGAASSIAEYGQKQQQFAAQQTAKRQNDTNALAAGRDQESQLQLRQIQEAQSYGQKDRVTVIQGAEKAAEASVSAANSGVAGISVDNLINDVGAKTAANRATLQQNYEATAEQLGKQQEATVNTEQSRINSVAEPTAPSILPTLVGIAGAGVKSYAATKGAGQTRI